ncbi:MAG: hypothetical protein WC310_05965 [Patescibacteria group bacterium]|jgi:hypothetical protein
MKTEQIKFRSFLKQQGFRLSPVLSTFPLIAHHCIDVDKNHVIVKNISVCMFLGAETKDIVGCVVFYFGGIERKYKQKYVNERAELQKRAIVCKTAKEAILQYNNWHKQSQNWLKTLKTIL